MSVAGMELLYDVDGVDGAKVKQVAIGGHSFSVRSMVVTRNQDHSKRGERITKSRGRDAMRK